MTQIDPGTDSALTDRGALPVLPLRETAVFPHAVVPLLVGRPRSKRLVEDLNARELDRVVLVGTRSDTDEPGPADLFELGTLARVVQALRFPDGNFRLVVEGLERVRLDTFTRLDPYLMAEIEPLEDALEESPRLEALVRQIRSGFQTMVGLAPYLADQLLTVAVNIEDPSHLSDFVASCLSLDAQVRQDLLETLDVEDRLEKLLRSMTKELEILEMGSRIQEQVEAEVEQGQREFLLRKQLEAIRRELGESDEQTAEVEELRTRLEEAALPEEARKEAMRELNRLESLPAASPEHHVIRTFLDWMIRFPWAQTTEDRIDVSEARQVLDEDHYGLEKIKDRIVEYLAVRKLKQDMRGPILCFVGPPGVGKTSLGRSIARALGREFVRLSLGGVRDEAEIRGHRRTYIGAFPGRIVQSLVRAGTSNPVMMLDEVDKLGVDVRGDPSAALLEVLDPEQNVAFRDHYLDVAVDLSQVMFITTANVLHTIPPALRDRMEIIEVPGYTTAEKVEIGRRHLVPKQLDQHGLVDLQVRFEEESLRRLVTGYTREAGVRELDRSIAAVCRKAAAGILEGRLEEVTVDESMVQEFLGRPRYRQKLAEEHDEVGVTAGLSVTPAGGEVLFVEAALVPGDGELTITGQLGDVMRESVRAAVTYARSRSDQLGVDPGWPAETDIHIHVPEGAVPKDGPSAGVTMTTALISALTGRPVSKSVGMTGEVTLRGKVLPIGGVKEKVLAAHTAGLASVLLPADNEKDLEDVPEEVREGLEIRLVSHMDEVLAAALLPAPQALTA